MKIVKKIKKIEDYQLKELEDKTLYINKYDLSLKYNYELASTWKEFFFDILDELLERNYKESRLDFTTDYANAYKRK